MVNNVLKVGIVAAEKSGDSLAANLIESFHHDENVKFFGVVGPKMREVGCFPVGNIENLSVMGFKDVVLQLPRLIRLKNSVCDALIKHEIDVFIGVDAPSFNLPIAAKLKSLNSAMKVIQYVAPQLWAWRPGRIEKIKKIIDHLYVLFPFEKKYFSEMGLNTDFVGHPVANAIATKQKPQIFTDFSNMQAINLAVLPGSRWEEIRNHTGIFLESVKIFESLINKKINLKVGASSKEVAEYLKKRVEKYQQNATFYIDDSIGCLNQSDLAVVSSGTASLEAFLSSKPMIVGYKTGKLNYFLYKNLINLDSISLPNILTESKIVPELIQDNLTAQSVAKQLMLWTIDNRRLSSYRQVGSNFLTTLNTQGNQTMPSRFREFINKLKGADEK